MKIYPHLLSYPANRQTNKKTAVKTVPRREWRR